MYVSSTDVWCNYNWPLWSNFRKGTLTYKIILIKRLPSINHSPLCNFVHYANEIWHIRRSHIALPCDFILVETSGMATVWNNKQLHIQGYDYLPYPYMYMYIYTYVFLNYPWYDISRKYYVRKVTVNNYIHAEIITRPILTCICIYIYICFPELPLIRY